MHIFKYVLIPRSRKTGQAVVSKHKCLCVCVGILCGVPLVAWSMGGGTTVVSMRRRDKERSLYTVLMHAQR